MSIKSKINGVPIELTEKLVQMILQRKPVKKIMLYGSRATKNFKNTSDIDIAILDDDWTGEDIALSHNDMEEFLSTPLKFDLVLFKNIKKDSLKKSILSGVVLYESE